MTGKRALRLTNLDNCPNPIWTTVLGHLAALERRHAGGCAMSERTTHEQIVEAADELFYRRGYENTSFADIADVVQISRGNFYYHFKSKDDILDAVIRLRLANTKRMLAQWESEGEHPADRIRSFIHMLTANQAKIM